MVCFLLNAKVYVAKLGCKPNFFGDKFTQYILR